MSQNNIVGVRFDEADKKLLRKVCNLRGEDLSDFVRRAVKRELAELNYGTQEQKKALGVPAK